MNPTPTGRIIDTNIIAVNNTFVTVYFVDTGEGYALFDTGVDPENLKKQMEDLKISVNDVKWVFLSHSDRDHVAGLVLFPNAQIFISEAEIVLLDGTKNRFGDEGNKLPEGVDLNRLTKIKDQQEFKFNETTIKSFLAPGHTPGTTLYLVDNRHLFTGDALSYIDGEIGVHPFTIDEAKAKESISKFGALTRFSKLVLTSHYGIINNHCGKCGAH
jgi:glyoxylase-like metal-dependent hydrolase (beta-lactamase superfamily II)